jgi:SMC interacting uncharacterized protein involved in chromosome segregation
MSSKKEQRAERNLRRDARKARKAAKAEAANTGGYLAKLQQDLELNDEELAGLKAIRHGGGDRAAVRKALTPNQLEQLKQAREKRKADKQLQAQ